MKLTLCWCGQRAEYRNQATDATPAGPVCGQHVKDGFEPLAAAVTRAREATEAYGPTNVSREDYEALMHSEWAAQEEAEWQASCPACGEVADYCQGHGELGDPEGAAVLAAHDADDHSRCHPAADCAPELCGRSYVFGPAHDLYGTECEKLAGHRGDHEGPDPLGSLPGDRLAWQGGGSAAGDRLPVRNVRRFHRGG